LCGIEALFVLLQHTIERLQYTVDILQNTMARLQYTMDAPQYTMDRLQFTIHMRLHKTMDDCSIP